MRRVRPIASTWVLALLLRYSVLLRDATDAFLLQQIHHRAFLPGRFTLLLKRNRITAFRPEGRTGVTVQHGAPIMPSLRSTCFYSHPLNMGISAENLRVAVSQQDSDFSTNVYLYIEASYHDRDRGILRTWTTRRSEAEFTALGLRLIGILGASSVPAPPPSSCSVALMEGYLRRVLTSPRVMGLPVVHDFLEIPPDMIREPVLLGEVSTVLSFSISWGAMAMLMFRDDHASVL